MTSKLKCPVCCGELEEVLPIVKVLGCPKCKLFGCIELYERLEQSQKDLEESQQATLENAQTVLEIHKDLDIATKALKELWRATHYDTDGYLGKTIQHTLEQITHDNSEKPNSVEHKDENNG